MPARAQHSASTRAITARQLQALVRLRDQLPTSALKAQEARASRVVRRVIEIHRAPVSKDRACKQEWRTTQSGRHKREHAIGKSKGAGIRPTGDRDQAPARVQSYISWTFSEALSAGPMVSIAPETV